MASGVRPTSTDCRHVRFNDRTSKNWLVKNSLKAKGLLLEDALHLAFAKETCNSRRNAYPCSKSDALAFLAKAPHQLFSNPYLERTLLDYESNLKGAISDYNDRLDSIVWDSLSLKEKMKFPTFYVGHGTKLPPVRFQIYRNPLLKALERCGWPVTDRDILLLEEEIMKAKDYLEQSKSIRELSKNVEKRIALWPVGPYVILGKTPVIAQKSTDGFYYDGLVIKSAGCCFVDVQFDSGETETVCKQFVIACNSKVERNYMLGDYVLVRKVEDDGCLHYEPGSIERIIKTISSTEKLYGVILYNGERVLSRRLVMVKIEKTKYDCAKEYIAKKRESKERIIDAIKGSEKMIGELHKSFEKMENSCKAYQECIDDVINLAPSPKLKPTPKAEPEPEPTPRPEQKTREVLARWYDDGWYYWSEVADHHQHCLRIRDNSGQHQFTPRKCFIPDDLDSQTKVKPGDFVITMHPDYLNSWAPAMIEGVPNGNTCNAVFYDEGRHDVLIEHVYVIDEKTYERDIELICKRDEELIGQYVIVRDDNTGVYKTGKIIERLDHRKFSIKLSDGTPITQEHIHIFRKLTPKRELDTGDHCLSIADIATLTFLPGIVTAKSERGLMIKLVNSTRLEEIPSIHCIWISKDYYDAVCAYYKRKKRVE